MEIKSTWKTFELFLKERGAWTAYCKNVVKLNSDVRLSDMKRVPDIAYLHSAFMWQKTPEGNEYWLKLDNEWLTMRLSARK